MGLAAAGGGAALGLVSLLGPPTLRAGDRVLLIGDSLAVGLAAPLGALAGDAGIAFQSLATVGTRIDQWAQNPALPALLASFQPTVVLVSLGTNDSYMQPSPGEDIGVRQAPYLEQLLETLEAARPRAIVWLSPPTLPAAAVSLGPVMRLIESEHAVRFPEIKPRVAFFPSQSLVLPRGPDGIHPTPRGYAAWAGAIFQWLT